MGSLNTQVESLRIRMESSRIAERFQVLSLKYASLELKKKPLGILWHSKKQAKRIARDFRKTSTWNILIIPRVSLGIPGLKLAIFIELGNHNSESCGGWTSRWKQYCGDGRSRWKQSCGDGTSRWKPSCGGWRSRWNP